jgi:hypothetical protein
MYIPTPRCLLRSGLAWLLVLTATPLFARGPEQPLRIPLEDFGFQPLSPQFLLNGSSMLTLNYVDEKHLLVTFVTHRLIPRLPNEPADDQDRIVDAILLELPSAKILARTSWHLHDHARYLWNLGHGHFLLRVRDSLTTFAPLANLSAGQPFAEHPFITSAERRLAVLIISPDSDLLIVESVKRKPPDEKPKTALFGPTPQPKFSEKDPVQINFYRLHSGDDAASVSPVFAGAVISKGTGDIPASTAGYLAVVDQGNQHWAFDFHSYAGKVNELSPFDSTCSPAPLFVSHSEFIAFGCRGGQTMQQIGGFNMRGEEMWEQGLFGAFIAPSLAYAPAGGRFALSRIMLRNSVVPDQMISNDEVSSQTVVVYQTGTGKQLLHADCSPVERAGQNFDLSPSGTALAVVHADAIEIYKLPPLTSKDESDLKLAQTSAPPENNLPIHFAAQAASSTDADADAIAPQSGAQSFSQPSTQSGAANNTPSDLSQSGASTQQTTATPDATPAPQTTPPPATQPLADPSPDQQHRPPPTIYTLPTDKAPTPDHPKDPPQ